MIRRVLVTALPILSTLCWLGIFLLVISQIYQTKDQVKALKTIQENQAKAVIQLNNSVNDLKADNEKNLQIIICMLQVPIAQRTTNMEANCRKAVSQTEAVGITATVPATPANTPASQSPSNPTAPEPPKPITQTITDFVGNALKTIGL